MAGLVEDRALAQKMPLCIDGRLRAARATGVAAYADAVVAALESVGRAPLMLDDATRGRFGAPPGLLDRARRWARARSAAPVRLVLDGARLSARDVFRLAQARFDHAGELLRLVAPGAPGVMHWTYPIPARVEGWINVYTVHDVIPLTHPGLSTVAADGLRARLTAIAASANRLVTVSEASRAAIAAALALPPESIANCGGAIPPMRRAGGPLPRDLARDGYYVFCGMNEPRKNLPRIVSAWRSSGSARPLVIAGQEGGEPIDLSGTVRVGFLPRAELLDLIADARALVFSTLEEGFGLPVVEAMALGVPVITSDRGALAETAGGAALTVDPGDDAAIAVAIGRIDRDDALCRALVERGRLRAAAFSAAAFGRRLLTLYADLAGDSPLRP